MKSKSHHFPSTRWSQLDEAKTRESGGEIPVLETVARAYWRPLRDFLRSQGTPDQDASDLVQGFFEHALKTHLFQKAARERGRFRTFLLSSLGNYVKNTHRHAQAARRRPKGGMCSLEDADMRYYHPPSLVDPRKPDEVFHLQWVRMIIARVIQSLKDLASRKGQETHFAIFDTWVLAPELEGVKPPPLLELARRHGLPSKTATNAVITMKRAFRRLLLEEVRSYAGTAAEAEMETRDVLAALHLEPVEQKI